MIISRSILGKLGASRSRATVRPRRHLEADLLTRAEVEALLHACHSTTWIGLRNQTLIIVLWRTGLRISEALALQEKDIDLVKGQLVVQRGKGGKRRVVGLDQNTVETLRVWLHERDGGDCALTTLVFTTRHGGRIDSSYVRRLLPRLAREAGLAKRVHAHGLRHAFATELEAEGAPLSVIRDLLGHTSLATTDAYLRRLGAGEAVQFTRHRSWHQERS